MATTTGELREMLVSAIEDLRAGKIDPEEAKAISGLAAQINKGFQIEVNAMREMRSLGMITQQTGSNPLGEITVPALLGDPTTIEKIIQ